ncbi:molybdenum cofactor biosynthesis protein B [Actinomyces slackii]|uniref:Molybdenum cofactor biosynthesis protein B n=1 Tax=Actinomyces slackii TaxID=52774 RepID=A0A3S4WLW0_9ACTO|nr:MogA/MoaB family molybdenum cofactor biosynthesis protein [Actinomyces slackii]VEG75803.1 Molybdenum cofactor biosynthesis protein B [Actinomyces slackii]
MTENPAARPEGALEALPGRPRAEGPDAEKGLKPLPAPVAGAVITVSDRCAEGRREDLSGPLAVELLARHGVIAPGVVVVPDGVEPVREAIEAAVAGGARVVLTTGGTGVTPRDLTPEGTAPLLQARMEGLEAQIRAHGLTKTPLAGLSRGLVGVTSREAQGALVVNAPGSRGGVKDTVAVIGPLVPHVLEQLGGGDH